MEVVHHPQIAAYLDAVCAQVQHAETHAEIRLEMAGHLADRTQAGLDAGLPEADAVAQAIQFSGDPIMVGRQLNQAHQPRTDWKLLGTTLLLVLLGIWAMYAIEVSGSSPLVGFNLFARKLIWSAVGLVVAFAATILDYRLLRRLAWPLLAATLLGMFWVGTLGPRANGQAQWLSLAPLVLAPALAGIFATWDWRAPRAWLKGLGLLLMPLLALVIGSSLFTVLECGVLFWVIAVASRPSWRQALPMAATSVLLASTTVLQRPHLRNRLLGWLHPQSDPLGMNYAAVRSLESLRQAGP